VPDFQFIGERRLVEPFNDRGKDPFNEYLRKFLLRDYYRMTYEPTYRLREDFKCSICSMKDKHTFDPMMFPFILHPYCERFRDFYKVKKYITQKVKKPIDYEERLFIANLIGLKELPKPDPKGIKELSGCLSKKIKADKINSVELVREVRGS